MNAEYIFSDIINCCDDYEHLQSCYSLKVIAQNIKRITQLTRGIYTIIVLSEATDNEVAREN